MIEIGKSSKKSLEAFKYVGEKKSSFRKDPSHSQNESRGGGRQVIETIIVNMVHSRVRFKIIADGSFNMGVQQHKVNTSLENLKKVPFTNNSKLVLLASMTLIHPVVRKLLTKEIANVPLAGRLSQFVRQWKKTPATKKFCQ